MKKLLLSLPLLMFCLLNTHAQVGIGTNSPHASSVLDVNSSKKGFLPPRLTNAERAVLDAKGNLLGPANGLVIYNVTEKCLQVNIGTKSTPNWICLNGSSTNNTATVSGLDCNSINFSDPVINVAYSETSTLDYTGGNGDSHSGASFSSTGVTGLTLTIDSGTLNTGTGAFDVNISGIPTTTGTAEFAVNYLGQTCTVSLTVGNTLVFIGGPDNTGLPTNCPGPDTGLGSTNRAVFTSWVDYDDTTFDVTAPTGAVSISWSSFWVRGRYNYNVTSGNVDITMAVITEFRIVDANTNTVVTTSANIRRSESIVRRHDAVANAVQDSFIQTSKGLTTVSTSGLPVGSYKLQVRIASDAFQNGNSGNPNPYSGQVNNCYPEFSQSVGNEVLVNLN